MSSQNILITGISGQDGVFLTSSLNDGKNSNQTIIGVTRQNPKQTFDRLKSIDTTSPNLKLVNIDLTSANETLKLISDTKPTHIYNLSGPSSVYNSINEDLYFQKTINSIFDNLTNACVEENIFPNFFQACSSEMFASTNSMPLNELSSFSPRSPYAEAKLEVYKKVDNLKEKYDWNIKSGIMFNHESEFRNKSYLFMKIFLTAKQIKNKEKDVLEVGSLDLSRDWSFAGDVSKAVQLINTSEESSNYVVGSGTSTSIREVVEIIFSFYGLKLENHIMVNPNLLRAEDPLNIVSDPIKLKDQLGWSPELSIVQLLERIFKKIG